MHVGLLSALAIQSTASAYPHDECLKLANSVMRKRTSLILPTLMLFEDLKELLASKGYHDCIPHVADLIIESAGQIRDQWTERYAELIGFREDLINYQARRLAYERPPGIDAASSPASLDAPVIPPSGQFTEVPNEDEEALAELGMTTSAPRRRILHHPSFVAIDPSGSPIVAHSGRSLIASTSSQSQPSLRFSLDPPIRHKSTEPSGFD